MPSINPAEAFNGGIKRPGVGFFYTIGLLGVAFVMALLPVIYLALTLGAMYLTYYHARYHLAWVWGTGQFVSGRLIVLKMFVYAIPIFVGVIVSLFMLKPFFARRAFEYQPYALNPEAEPVLYDFIRRVCEIVGAPMPSLIELNCTINAAAGFRHGFKSFFGEDLVLTIGLPLVAGLSVREFAGILAHEFGHFTQGGAMRLHYIIERIDMWFARVIWEHDAWDEWLEETTDDEDAGSMAVFAGFAQLGVSISRIILTLLLLFGHAFSCFLSRRMEFHADEFEIRVGGSAAFESATQRMNTLLCLHEVGMKQMRVAWNLNNRLPDNLPQYIINVEGGQTGAAVRKAMKGQLGFVKTGLFHTHPSDADRIRVARLVNAPGVVALDAPAADLFENFPVPCRIVTRLYYESMGVPTGLAKLYDVEVPKPKDSEIESETDLTTAAIDRYFSGIVTPLRPIFPHATNITDAQITETISQIEALPAQINTIAEQVAEACASFDRADKMMLAAAQETTAEGFDAATWRIERERARRSLHSVLEAYENRLTSALAIAQTDSFTQAAPNATEVRQRVTSGINILVKLQPILKLADAMRASTAALLQGGGTESRALGRLREEVADLEAAMREVPCPPELGKAASLYHYFTTLPAAQEPFLTPRAEALAALPMTAYSRVLGELVLLAEQIVEQMQTRKVMRVGSANAK